MKQALGAYTCIKQNENQFWKRINLVGGEFSGNQDQSCSINIFLMVKNELVDKILSNLDLHDLRSLSFTWKFFNEKIKLFLENDVVWERLLMKQYFVDRQLNGKSYCESFKVIDAYCSKNRQTQCDFSFDQTQIPAELTKFLRLLLHNKIDHLTCMFHAFGQNRNPSSLEMLVYFTANL